MSLEFQFDMSELNRMAARHAQGGRIVADETRTAMNRVVIQIEADAKRRVPTDTHNLQRSITHEVTTAGRDVIGRVGTNQPYAEAVEKGRRAGAPPPPASALTGWLRRKGIDQKYAWVIAQSIGRKGIRPRPYLKPGYDVNRLKIGRELGTVLMQRVSQRLAGNG